jgi:uncharacterized protein YndB with AHSA1/START domain
MKTIAILPMALCASLAQAEVVATSADGFTLRHTAKVAVPPRKMWAALIAWDKWWSPAHSYSGRAPKLNPRAGGQLSENWLGGSVLHASVLNAMPNKLLRLSGGFGPLQSMPTTAILDFKLEPDGADTRLTMTYSVAAPTLSKVDQLAAPVDAVLAEGFQRLSRFAVTGKPE